MPDPTLSIITATFNAADYLPSLVESLRGQTDQEFQWVVIDGGSQDGTVTILENIDDLPLVYLSESDFGIYDALNKGVRLASGEYYLVVGADDILSKQAVADYRNLIRATGADILTAAVEIEGQGVISKPRGRPWLWGARAYVVSHAVGSAFRKTLHTRQEIGTYSRKYPLVADQLFIKRAVSAGARVVHGDFLAGRFGRAGVSSTDLAGGLTEFFRVQLETEPGRGLQIALFMLRFLRYLPRLLRPDA